MNKNKKGNFLSFIFPYLLIIGCIVGIMTMGGLFDQPAQGSINSTNVLYVWDDIDSKPTEVC